MVSRFAYILSLSTEQSPHILPSFKLGSLLWRALPCSTLEGRLLSFSLPCASSRGGVGAPLALTLPGWSLLLHSLVKPLLWHPRQSMLLLHWLLPVTLVTTPHLLIAAHLVSTLTCCVLLLSRVASVLMARSHLMPTSLNSSTTSFPRQSPSSLAPPYIWKTP